MHPLFILSIAIAIVLIGILAFRLHAFLALLLAALTVALLTPTKIDTPKLEKSAVSFDVIVAAGGQLEFRLQLSPSQAAIDERFYVVRPQGKGEPLHLGELKIVRFEKTKEPASDSPDGEPNAVDADKVDDAASEDTVEPAAGTAIAVWVGAAVPVQEGDLALRPYDLMESRISAPAVVAKGFGDTCRSIGLLIAMASIIGKCLLDSGAADRVVRTALRLVGQKLAPAAFVASGFLLGIPVFFDTVFYLMIPLGKAMRMRTGENYLLYILTIVAGGTMAHSLVPPTPGPLLVAEELGVNLLTMILMGCLVGTFSAGCGYLFACWINRRMVIPLRESPDMTLAEMKQLAHTDESQLPPFWLAILPIVLPVLFIAIGTAMDSYLDQTTVPPSWAIAIQPTVSLLGDKNIALLIATAIALVMLAWTRWTSLVDLTQAVQAALASGGVIILITGAGGAFGLAVRESGVTEEIQYLTSNLPGYLILPVAFFITTLIRTAQGSATVAMITAVSVLANLAKPGVLDFHPVYLAMAIGCGSKPVAWMADSGFWVICKMSGMTEAEGLKTVSPLSVVMGVSGLLVTMALAALFPMQG
ncbi:GntP family permease [Lignipirellula cremea]|uniref:Inner membrane permease YgbN n=1 Tax=Lignipirellula cremea TaxID=2528010 RepID=A0A518DU90_9BACT|nr:SLC13 family permease [Lignipirellula cremea]QDU95412.1 Inner membrane permease YgbN [Lignipirellula cremea]